MSAALKLPPQRAEQADPEVLPDAVTTVRGNPRAIAVAKFRELADKLESGELDGARVEWRVASIDERKAGFVPRMATVTLTPQTDDNWIGGTVQLLVTTIEEG